MPARTAASHSWRKFRGRRGPTHRVASIERLESRLLLSAGSIVQLTDTSTDNRWPSLNDQGDYVYSAHDGAGYWQIFKNGVQITTDSYNKKYPVIANNGDVVYFKQGPTGGAFGTGWQVIRRSAAGTESQIESSSQNTVTGARRDAGRFPGIASNATSISYLDFYNPSPPPTRR